MRKTFTLDYEKIGNPTKKKYDELAIPVTYDVFRKACKHFQKTGRKRNLFVNDQMQSQQIAMKLMEESQQKTIATITDDTILSKLQAGENVTELDIKPSDLFAAIKRLRNMGYLIEFEDEKYKISKNIVKETKTFNRDWQGQKRIKIGVVSDTHIGNKNTQMSFLNHLYDIYEEEGITDVYHCGDISDGWYPNRSDQVYELFVHGADQQVQYIIDNYPRRKDITTHFIIGNHDYTFVRNTGYNIGPAIARERDDMEFLGINNAIVWLTPNCSMEMNHPGDGASYAMSYSIQKYIDSMMGGEKPNILLNGHHHKYLSMFYRNIHAYEVPCTEAQTNFMKSKRLAAHMGGLILDILVDEDGTITRIKEEMIPLYKAEKEDY